MAMSEWRPHWDDDLISAVRAPCWATAATKPSASGVSHVRPLGPPAVFLLMTKIRTIHRPDPTGSWCAHCQWEWPCRTFIYAGGGA